MTERDARWLAIASRAAERSRRSPGGPQPRAAALLVKGGVRIALVSGGEHPEQQLLQKAGRRARGATLYTTHPPRSRAAIRAAGVARVVVAPRAQVQRLNADYAKLKREGLPFVTLKAAVTLDGRIAARSGESKWITGPLARRAAHRLRAESDAVMVGVGTVLADDPALTVRLVRGPDPLRVVLDSELRTPARAALVRTARQTPTLIFHAAGASPRRASQLRAAGVELVAVPRARRGLDLKRALGLLAARGVVRVLVEGGAQVHGALLEAGLADAVAVFIAPRILGDTQARPLAQVRLHVSLADAWTVREPDIKKLGADVLVRGILQR